MGLSSQWMIGEEVTVGTGVTPTRAYEFWNDITLGMEIDRLESPAFQPGKRFLQQSGRRHSFKNPNGDIPMGLAIKAQGMIWKHCIGSVALTQPSAGPDPTVWDQTFTPATLIGKSLTIQVGRENRTGTVVPFTYTGCKIQTWQLGCNIGEFANLTLSVIGNDETTATALATPSYAANQDYQSFVEGSLTINAVATPIKAISMTCNNNLTTDDYVFGSLARREAQENALREITGTLDADWVDQTAYQRFTTSPLASFPMVLTFAGAIISNAYRFSTIVTMNVQFDGETPKGGQAEYRQPLAWKAVVPSGGQAITVVYRSTDTAI